MTAADLRGADADQTIVVPTDAVDAIDQLERRGLAAALDDLKCVIHRWSNPGWLAVGDAPGWEETRRDREPIVSYLAIPSGYLVQAPTRKWKAAGFRRAWRTGLRFR